MRRGVVLTAVSALVLSSLAVAPVAHAAFPGQNGRIAYVTASGDHRALYTVDAQGADAQALIDLGSGRDAINPAWSWDGQRIAFAGQESSGGKFVIYTANSDGTGSPQQITTDGPSLGNWQSDTDPTWSPDGKKIAFVRTLTDGSSRIWTVELATGATSRILVSADSNEKEPSWSPDGTRIAFASRPNACQQQPCRWGIRIWDLDRGWFTNPLSLGWGYDWHHPDWSPDGTMIVASFGDDSYWIFWGIGLQTFDVSSGEPLKWLGPCHLMTEPSFSPDGQWVVLTATPIDDQIGGLGEPNLCAYRTDGSSAYLLEGTPPRSDAAWSPVPGSAPPPIDLSPPTVEFRPAPSADGWLDSSAAGEVAIVATDDRSVPSIACTDDGAELSLSIERSGSTANGVVILPEGYHHIECTATDAANNSTTAAGTYKVDLTPPDIEGPWIAPTVVRVGEEVFASTNVLDFGSWVHSVEFRVAGLGTIPSSTDAPSYLVHSTASFVPTTPDLSEVVVSARDRVGWVAEASKAFVSYDPVAGSTDGTGWIVPGGSTSDPKDTLPGIDGIQRASFGFTAKYKTATSETPAGNLTFSYGSRFKLQSKQLSWLVVRDGRMAFLGGIAGIQGSSADFPFVATIVDGADTDSPDRFELRVYEPGTAISSPTPLFAASGNAGGQIQIKR